MEKRIRRLGIFMLLCFVALFLQLNNIQVLKANSLANSPNNPRILTAERSQTRGSILSSDGTVLASSVLAPKGSLDKYQRVYNPNTATLFAQIIGFDSDIYGNYRGIEAEYNSFLTPHTPPAKTLAGPAHQPHRGGQRDADRQREPPAAGGRGPRRGCPRRQRSRSRRLQPDHRRHRGDVLEPFLQPQPAGVPELEGPEPGLGRLLEPTRQSAGGRNVRPDLPTRFELQGGDHLGRARAPSRSGPHDLPAGVVRHPAQHRQPAPAADQLPRGPVRRKPRGAADHVV